MNLVQDHKAFVAGQGALEKRFPGGNDIPAQIGRVILAVAFEEIQGKRRLADLPWAAEKDHLLFQIFRYQVLQIALHTCLLRTCILSWLL